MPGVICKSRSEVGVSTDKENMQKLSTKKNIDIETAQHYSTTHFEVLRLSNLERLCLRLRHSLREGSSSLMSQTSRRRARLYDFYGVNSSMPLSRPSAGSGKYELIVNWRGMTSGGFVKPFRVNWICEDDGR